MSTQIESPVLRRIATVRRVDALFQAMSTDFLLRQQFITNPTHVLFEYVFGTVLPPDRTSASNQLLYSVLSDRKLLSWLHSYSDEHRDDVPSGHQFVTDLADAIAENGSRHAVIALLRSSVEGNGLVGFDEDLLHFFINLRVLADDGGDGGDGGTGDGGTGDGGTGDGGTGGTLTAVTWKTYLITRPQMEVDDRFSADQDREFAPRYVMVTLDELAQYAAGLRNGGALELTLTRNERSSNV
ncbi:hypothetical protein [Paraburkholderia strydomiana]|uniref:Uncharacterized protein n=1 Tax=Paraburkholderia strydomiana TaxID=1245417 RepID=A0ABW9BXM1_9BURK